MSSSSLEILTLIAVAAAANKLGGRHVSLHRSDRTHGDHSTGPRRGTLRLCPCLDLLGFSFEGWPEGGRSRHGEGLFQYPTILEQQGTSARREASFAGPKVYAVVLHRFNPVRRFYYVALNMWFPKRTQCRCTQAREPWLIGLKPLGGMGEVRGPCVRN